jgi:hypothetical protein
MAATASSIAVTREVLRIVRRHPRQWPERLMLFAVQRLGEPTRAWADAFHARAAAGELGSAAAGDTDAAVAARCAQAVHDTIVASRVDGAVSGTPFFIALVPAYVAFLWTQAQLVLRIAALQGRDTSAPAITAELLALRGIHPSVEAASAALGALDDEAPRARGWRARIVAWVEIVRRILILAAFVSPASPDDERPRRARQLVFGALGVVIWFGTYVFPVTFMLVMAWGCDRSSRELGAVALDYYEVAGTPDADAPEGAGGQLARARASLGRIRSPRRLAWAAGVTLSLAVPLGLIAISVSHVHHGSWVVYLAPIAGLALVLALTRVVTRRA